MDAFNWLHLSDLHWGLTGQKDLWPEIRKRFLDNVAALHAKCGPWQAVFFTGDLVQKGQDFDEMEEQVLGPLWERLQTLDSKQPVLLAVPGNHDLERPGGKNPKPAVRVLTTPGQFHGIADEFWDNDKCDYRKVISKAFGNYVAWWKTRPFAGSQQIKDGDLPGDFSTTFVTQGGHRIGVLGLNTTFLQLTEGDYEGRLAWGVRQFHAACDPDGVTWAEQHDVCLLLTHQGPEWLDNPSREKHYAEINPAGRFAVHLFGHMHEEAIHGLSSGGGSVVRHWQGPSLFGLETYKDKNGRERQDRRHGYGAGSVQFDDQGALLRHWPLRATFDATNGWRVVPDHEKCKLQDDGGTKPERLDLGEATKPDGPGLEKCAAQSLESYQRHVQLDWDARWSKVLDAADEKAAAPPFIDTQGMQLLLETDRPERFLRAEYFRAGRGASPAMGEIDRGTWAAVERSDVAANRVTVAGASCDLSRLVITTDAGVGKTVSLHWLEAVLNTPGSATVAFFLTFSHLPSRPTDLFRDALVPLFRQINRPLTGAAGGPTPTRVAPSAGPVLPEAEALAVLERLRAEGRLVLLLDGLDQAPPDGTAVETLRALLVDPDWRACRIVVSGRPHALQCHWDDLFATQPGHGWRFLQLDEFDEIQQRQFLGSDGAGRDRYELIPVEAREILSTPRMLEYLQGLPDRELTQIKTPGDVYWLSIQHLLKTGMKNSTPARSLGLAANEPIPTAVQQRSLRSARKLLGAIAFQMTAMLVPRPGAEAGLRVPNFDGVPPNEFETFNNRLAERLAPRAGEGNRELLGRDIDALAALNDFLTHGIFDTDVVGLDRFYWRNRTLQEFFTALWLAQYSTPEDAGLLGDWVYQPEQPLTEEYYWVWRFLCEMHPDARDPEGWTRAVQPLYRPGDGTAQGTKRSTEMMYRAWQPLDQLVRDGVESAREVQSRFLGEFESVILAGQRGPEAKAMAEQFRDHFVEVSAGEFRMGSPLEKQGLPEDLKSRWKAYLEQDGDPEQRAEQHMAGWPYPATKQGQQSRERETAWWVSVFRDRDLDRLARQMYTADETPEEPIQEVAGLLLNGWPTMNSWYRLFRPGHGEMASYYREQYAQISPQPDTPVIFVTWYDAWAFCLWAHWQSRSCRLPREYEWEYAAKASTPWDQNYWWGDEFQAEKCNVEQQVGHTTAPSATHANPWGFVDILGNVWEWCEDEYRAKYHRDKSPESSARVLRGGSWCSIAWYTRSALRSDGQPASSSYDVGFRVARAL